MAERIITERMPVDSLLGILKPQEEIFPSEPKAIQIVKSDPTLSHNFAYFSLIFLGCQDDFLSPLGESMFLGQLFAWPRLKEGILLVV